MTSKLCKLKTKYQILVFFDTKLRKSDTKVTLSKTRQVHTEKS